MNLRQFKSLLEASEHSYDKRTQDKIVDNLIKNLKKKTITNDLFSKLKSLRTSDFNTYILDVFNLGKELGHADQFLFDSHFYKQKQLSRVSEYIIVTSISPNPARAEVQQKCLDSWKKMGLEVLCVIATDEDIKIKTDYLIKTDNLCPAVAAKPTIKISEMIKLGATFGKDILLINSDIEIIDAYDLLKFEKDRVTVGIRWNYYHNKIIAKRELCGIDSFYLPYNMAKEFEDAPFGIGRPTWDYWLVSKSKKMGYKVSTIDSPLFFHKNHDINYNSKDWKYFTKIYMDEFGGNWKVLGEVCNIRNNLLLN